MVYIYSDSGQVDPDWKYRVGVLSSFVNLYLAKDNMQAVVELM